MIKYKKELIVLTVFLLSLGDCFGAETGILYKIGYQADDGNFYHSIVVTYMEGANKGFDGEGMWPSVLYGGIRLGVRKVNGVDQWNGTTGWYIGDIREPLALGQSIIVDGIYLWAVPGTSSQDMHLRLIERPWLYPSESGSFSLSLVSIPQGVDYTGPTTWGPETSEITLPFYSTDNGETGYKFQMNMFAVPEPSGVLALVAGLLGLGGTLIKRRML